MPSRNRHCIEMSVTDQAIEACIVELLAQRAVESSICPSDVARALATKESAWRALMPRVREVAARLAAGHMIVVTQGHKTVVIDDGVRGPIRLRRSSKFPG